MAHLQDYFLRLSNKKIATNLREFTGNLDTAIANISLPREISEIFSFAAQAVSTGNKALLFPNWAEQRQARHFMIDKTLEWKDRALGYYVAHTAGDIFHAFDAYNLLATLPAADFSGYGLKKSKEQMDRFALKQLTYLPKYLANLAIYPGDSWIESWWTATHKVIDKMEPVQIYRILRAVSIFDCLRPVDIKIPSPTQRIGHMILDCIEKTIPEGTSVTLPSEVYFAATWFDKDFVKNHKNQNEQNCHSRDERNLYNAIFALGGVESAGSVIKGIDHTLDLSFTFHKVAVACEMDGVYHFVSDPEKRAMHYDGSTRFQSALIERTMPEDMRVLRIPYGMSQTLFRNRDVLQEMLATGTHQPAGVYIVHAANDMRPIDNLQAWSFFPKAV